MQLGTGRLGLTHLLYPTSLGAARRRGEKVDLLYDADSSSRTAKLPLDPQLWLAYVEVRGQDSENTGSTEAIRRIFAVLTIPKEVSTRKNKRKERIKSGKYL